jgi:hypothetical protein
MQGSHDDYQQLADLPFDPFEVLVLEITRHFIVEFITLRRMRGWMRFLSPKTGWVSRMAHWSQATF